MEMTRERAIEIATMACNKLKENDADSAQHFFQEEIDMQENEAEFLGVKRNRTAVNVVSNVDNIPDEVDIPWDIFDDDIQNYLEEEYNAIVDDYEIEEEN